jgi:RNA polymerase sigma factor (sigma-70 family)
MSEVSTHTTQVLLARVRAGDDQARGELVRRVEPLLRRFARGRLPQALRHEQDTADLLQRTWLNVLDRLDGITTTQAGDFFAYLRTVLVNALRESLRRQAASPVRAGGDDTLSDDQLPASGAAVEDWLAYEQMLATLPPDLRTLLLMRFEFGMSFAEIGTELGEAPDTVRMRLKRAIERVVARVGDEAGPDHDRR